MELMVKLRKKFFIKDFTMKRKKRQLTEEDIFQYGMKSMPFN